MIGDYTLSDFYYGDGFTFLILVTMCAYLVLEIIFPLYKAKSQFIKRWYINIGLYVFNMVVLYSSIYFLTDWAVDHEFGFFHTVYTPTIVTQFLAFLLIFDFCQYAFHWASHRYSILWRIHLTHHADPDIDATTSLRHHPFDFVRDYTMKLPIILLLGLSFEAFIIYEIVLTLHTFFAHSNLRFPTKIERSIQKLLITPDFHRVHHSIHPKESNNNYGFIFTIWDQIFGTVHNIAQEHQKEMKLGLHYFREGELSIWKALTQPFRYKRETVPHKDIHY